jgi:3-oxoacyl-[acyl-carrier-protein] synthase-1
MIYIGAETIISPLGPSIHENFAALKENRSGITQVAEKGFNGEAVYLSKILSGVYAFETLISIAVKSLLSQVDPTIINLKSTILIISSTKGELDESIKDPFGPPVRSLIREFGLAHQPIVISNACISGVLAINLARNLVEAGHYEHAIVAGCDVISDFVVYGFQSLFAVSDLPCRPFDASRKGITMGEGCGAVMVSATKTVFNTRPMALLPGTSANDANHISGPSRTGEGLFRTIKKTLQASELGVNEIDFISAHGTATVFNDEMESIAFDRMGLAATPVHSLKGYFGHTLGAAGVIETAASIRMMREQTLIKSLGYEQPGTSVELNVIKENTGAKLNTLLKTASGFGGGNASLLIRKL